MIWYFALICLGFVNYPFSLIIQSVIIMYMLYVFTTALLYICISLFLKPFKKLRRYYVRKIYLITSKASDPEQVRLLQDYKIYKEEPAR